MHALCQVREIAGLIRGPVDPYACARFQGVESGRLYLELLSRIFGRELQFLPRDPDRPPMMHEIGPQGLPVFFQQGPTNVRFGRLFRFQVKMGDVGQQE